MCDCAVLVVAQSACRGCSGVIHACRVFFGCVLSVLLMERLRGLRGSGVGLLVWFVSLCMEFTHPSVHERLVLFVAVGMECTHPEGFGLQAERELCSRTDMCLVLLCVRGAYPP